MSKIYAAILSVILVSLGNSVYAADPTADAPPAHKQKKALPDTNASGDYLETQDKNAVGNKNKHEGTTPSSAQQKGERFKSDPEKGGTEVKQK